MLPVEVVKDPDCPVYLNTAAVGQMSLRSLKAQLHHLTLFAKKAERHFGELEPIQQEAREALARILGVPPTDVGFVGSTSHGMDLFTQLPRPPERRRIVCPAGEFPSSVLPWRAKGFDITLVSPHQGEYHEQAFREVMDSDVFAVVSSACLYADGTRIDLGMVSSVAHHFGALSIANVTQAAGLLPLSLVEDGVDLAAGNGHKWLCSGTGNGFVYLPEPFRDQLPAMGWLSVTDPFAMRLDHYQRKTTAAVVEYGGMSILPRVALLESLHILEEVGIGQVFKYTKGLADLLRQGAQERGIVVRGAQHPRYQGATVNLQVSDPPGRVAALTRRGIAVSARAGLRVSPYITNSEGDIEVFWRNFDTLWPS